MTKQEHILKKCGHIALVGVYGTKYNNFPLGNMFTRNVTLKNSNHKNKIVLMFW